MLKNKLILVGVTGGIAAYKSALLASKLKDLGANVFVIMTKSAQKLVGPATFRTLTGNPVITDLFDDQMLLESVPHISLTQKADLMIIAPCTANMLGKMAHGIADDALSSMALACRGKKLIAPAMNTSMWENPLVIENVRKLKALGISFAGPAKGKLACGDEGIGRMSEPDEILSMVKYMLFAKDDLSGLKIIVTAGATQESIDPVRFISNRSSGKMGYAIAQAAAERGARVTLISGPTLLEPPQNVKFVPVTSAQEMYEQVKLYQKEGQVVIMAAAVADYKPRIAFWQKLKKGDDDISLQLEQTPDILHYLGQHKNGHYLVGFSLETENLVFNATEKMERKNVDLMIANDETTLDSDDAQVRIIHKNGHVEEVSKTSKHALAHLILDKIRSALS